MWRVWIWVVVWAAGEVMLELILILMGILDRGVLSDEDRKPHFKGSER